MDTGLAVSGMSLKGFLSHTIPTTHHRGDGQQRDPADRGVLDVLRHRRRVAGGEV
ncbi:hypothetical protein LNQ03_02085 [Klebsiella pneumoniae subsp. pneumoniae]|nr:hypothetical protein [Klebsiella pneumoniae subsp. pneumoniae]